MIFSLANIFINLCKFNTIIFDCKFISEENNHINFIMQFIK